MELTNSDTSSIVYAIDIKENNINSTVSSFNLFLDEVRPLIENQFRLSAREVMSRPKPDRPQAIDYTIGFKDVVLVKSAKFVSTGRMPRTPVDDVNASGTYAADISAVVVCTLTELDKDNQPMGPPITYETKQYSIGSVPIMVNSNRCNLHQLSREARYTLGEDPDDVGGYFIINGTKRVLLSRVNTAKNQVIIAKSTNGNHDLVAKFTSQAGDGSGVSRFLQTILHPNEFMILDLTIGKELSIVLPFYALFHLYDVMCDQDIIEYIIPEYDPTNRHHIAMRQHLTLLFAFDFSKLKRDVVAKHNLAKFNNLACKNGSEYTALIIAESLLDNDSSTSKVGYSFATQKDRTDCTAAIKQRVDENFLTQIGTTPNVRPEKLKFFGSIIYQLLEVADGKAATNRNNSELNVTFDSALTMIPLLKTAFNAKVAQPIKAEVRRILSEEGRVTESVINAMTLTRGDAALCKFISRMLVKSGPQKHGVTGHTFTSRATTNVLDASSIGGKHYQRNARTLDQDTMNDNVGETTREYRNVHPSTLGAVDPIHSVEGKKTGVVSQRTIGSKIAFLTDVEPIIQIIREDTMESSGFSDTFFVNALQIGSPKNCSIQRQLRIYRARQRSRTARQISIHDVSFIYTPIENGNVKVVTHPGRSYVPYLIVYGVPYSDLEESKATWPLLPTDPETGKEMTMEELKKSKDHKHDLDMINAGHKQWVRFTKAHSVGLMDGSITIYDLQRTGVIEFRSTDEQKNMYIADSIERFSLHTKSHLNPFTHVGIPESMVSYATMTAPFGDRTRAVRLAYQGKFTKQTPGEPPANMDVIMSSKSYNSFSTYNPIAQTYTDQIMPSAGIMTTTFIMSDGDNQEDSVIISKRFANCGIAAMMVPFTTTHPLETNQIFCKPDPTVVQSLRCTSYDHLNADGSPIEGSIIHKGEAILGIIQVTKDANGDDKRIDKSIMNEYNFPIVVESVYSSSNIATNTPMRRVKHHSYRIVEGGDKFASVNGGKCVVSDVRDDALMPYTADGRKPDMILNIASFTTRMLAGQISSANSSTIYLAHGKRFDASTFAAYNQEESDRLAAEAGLDPNSLCVVFDPKTGRRRRGRVCCTTALMQRLFKMSKDSSSYCNKPQTDINTRQPKKSIAHGGGSKYGIMEINMLISQGCAQIFDTTLYTDSDGTKLYVCTECGSIAAVSAKDGRISCLNRSCKFPLFACVRNSFATTSFIQKLSNIGTRMTLVPRKIEL